MRGGVGDCLALPLLPPENLETRILLVRRFRRRSGENLGRKREAGGEKSRGGFVLSAKSRHVSRQLTSSRLFFRLLDEPRVVDAKRCRSFPAFRFRKIAPRGLGICSVREEEAVTLLSATWHFFWAPRAFGCLRTFRGRKLESCSVKFYRVFDSVRRRARWP